MIEAPPGAWLSVREVAKWLDVHPNTVKRIPAADLPFMSFGTRGDRKYREVDVIAYIQKRMVNA